MQRSHEMVGVRQKLSGSWLDPECSGLLGWKLEKRLFARCKGEKGVFITLTYRRDEYADARELYYRQSERKDVALFMRRLGRRLGMSLRGKWLCKMEFQRGGWVHFHIVLLGVERIEHAVLTEAWTHGFTYVKRLTPAKIRYTAKYVCKGGCHNLPAWIYGMKPRSVKIVRVSRDFWPEEDRRKSTRTDDNDGWGKQSIPGYVPIGVKLRRRGVVIKRDVGRFSIQCDPAEFIVRLGRIGRFFHASRGWLWYFVKEGTLDAVAAACDLRSVTSGADRRPPPPGGLHLRGTSNRDADAEAELPWWLQKEFEDEAREQFEVEADPEPWVPAYELERYGEHCTEVA